MVQGNMTIQIVDLRCQHEEENRLVPREKAVFSWRYEGDEGAFAAVWAAVEGKAGSCLWKSGEYDRPVTRLVYQGPRLDSAEGYRLTVTLRDREGRIARAERDFDTALAFPEDFHAQWIWMDADLMRPTQVNQHYTGYSSPYFRRRFRADGSLRRAVLYASALGVYELHLNGSRLHDTYFDPGWTDYRRRIAYQAYDVTELIRRGENRLDVCLGEGWYRGFIIFHDKNYGDIPLKIFCQLRLDYADGRREWVVSDDSWRAGTGPLRYSDFQMGEGYVPDPAEGSDAFYRYPVRAAFDKELNSRLTPQLGPPIRRIGVFTPRLLHWCGEAAVFDVGQNISGFLRLDFQGVPAGRELKIVYGEMLEPAGGVYTANLRIAEQVDYYTVLGRESESYRPHFTVHGFQYAAIYGLTPRELDRVQVTAEALSAACPPAGNFSCGEPLVNKLYSNLLWGQRGNFSTVPTDCPQRNERIGWTGDAQIFCATACYNMDCLTYYQKYCRDMFDSQLPDGAFPDVAPLLYDIDGSLLFEKGNAAWADAGIIIPWRLYTFYQDRAFLGDAYPYMARYARYLIRHSSDDLYCRANYGDWLNIRDDTVRAVLATAYAAYDMDLMSRSAAALGREEDAAFYRDRFQRIQTAFYRHFVDEKRRILGNSQTSYVLALHFGLSRKEEDRAAFAAHLAERIRQCDGHLSSGFVGISYLLPALCDNGYAPLAYDLLLNKTYPSWLYSVVNGATTIWERWNSYTREEGFGDVSMNSFNHYSLGSVGEWFYSHCAGIRPTEGRGFSQVLFYPYPDRRLGRCEASYLSAWGRIESAWRYEGGGISFRFTLPPSVKGSVCLPAEEEGDALRYHPNRRTEISLDAGTHRFFLPVPQGEYGTAGEAV